MTPVLLAAADASGGDMLVPGVLVSIVMLVVGALLKRAIDANDNTQKEMKVAFTVGLERLGVKVDALGQKDNDHSEAIVELRIRLSNVEGELKQTQRSIQRRRSTDKEGA